MAATHPLAAIARRRDRVAAAVAGAVGPSGFDPARAAEAALAVLPPNVPYSAVYQSLLPLLGPTPPTPEVVRTAAWAIAGDLATLRTNSPVYPPTPPRRPTAVVAQILACRRIPAHREGDEGRVRYRLKVVKGVGCPITFEATWADRFIRFRASHPTGLGFSRPPRGNRTGAGRPYVHPDTLVGMLAKVVLDVDSQTGRPRATAVGGTPALRAYNQALIDQRSRTKGFRCPYDYTHACHQCPRGQVSCPVACRPFDLVVGQCPVCSRPDAILDPAWPGVPCGRCKGRRPMPMRKEGG